MREYAEREGMDGKSEEMRWQTSRETDRKRGYIEGRERLI